ncbi:hypothetical protein [Noviherbaspirillum aridicola]|nr:hypothetical protein [Noviherbaspirillum aridicola]
MTVLLILLAAAALFAAIHHAAPLLALDDDWERSLPPAVEDLELLLTAGDEHEDDRGWVLWRPDFNQKKVFL